MFYGNVFKGLNKAKVKYVVAGGTAVVLHGYTRFTQDLDLIVYLEPKNLGLFFEALKKINFLPKVPVTKEQFSDAKQRKLWKKEKGAVVFSFVNKNPPFQLIDIFIDEPINFDEVYKQKKVVRIEGVSIPLISIDHLLKLKRKAGRGKDLDDIVQLTAIKHLEGK